MKNIERERIGRQGVPRRNVMIDSLVAQLDRARRLRIARAVCLEPQRYVVSTFHRPSNVDDANSLRECRRDHQAHLCQATDGVAAASATRQALERFGLLECLERIESLHLSEPLGYLELFHW
jgi:UDP-N-acetylglucosamine 2-epimerase (non-hydrolysing)